MRICILGSVALPIPPIMQGGTERIAYMQAIGLARRGHEVKLIAAKGSKSEGLYRLVEIGGGDTVEGAGTAGEQTKNETITETSRKMRKEAVYWAQVIEWLYQNADSYDVILNNMRGAESVFVPVAKKIGKPFTTVMHLPIFPELAELFVKNQTPVITISNAQRDGFPNINYLATIYNSIDIDQFTFSSTPGEYLLMMGSIAPHKNQSGGIEIANKLNMKLVIAGKVSNAAYYEEKVKGLIDGTQIVHVGEIGLDQKAKLYAGAKTLLFPIQWEEPFGLVMIEAMATGTPVVAYGRGAVPEVVVDGKTGFIVSDDSGKQEGNDWIVKSRGIEGCTEAINRIWEIDRGACRKHVEEHFNQERLVNDFETALSKLAS